MEEALQGAPSRARSTPSRVTGAEAERFPSDRHAIKMDTEFYELPHCAHPGLCWLALELGDPVDGCICLKRFI